MKRNRPGNPALIIRLVLIFPVITGLLHQRAIRVKMDHPAVVRRIRLHQRHFRQSVMDRAMGHSKDGDPQTALRQNGEDQNPNALASLKESENRSSTSFAQAEASHLMFTSRPAVISFATDGGSSIQLPLRA